MAQKTFKNEEELIEHGDLPEAFLTARDVNSALSMARKRFKPLYGMSFETLALHSIRIPEAQASGLHILIEGETGTGKELVAQKIMEIDGKSRESERDVPCISVNCAAISESLIDSELFGHVKGAFTGADKDKIGLIEKAEGGILFLDEFHTFPPDRQAKLLRVIQEEKYFRVGDSEQRTLKPVRFIAAVQKSSDLRPDVTWRFPERITLKPLRERREDVFAILHCLLPKHLKKDLDEKIQWMISPTTMLAMLLSPWHGNVRELDNAARISVERWRKWHKPGSPIHVPFFYTADGDTKLSLDFERRAYENWQEISGRLRKEDMKRLIKTDFSEIPYPMYRGETGANHELGIPTGVEPSFFITLTDILKTLQESYQKRFPEYRKQKKGQEVVPGVTSYSSAHCCEEIRWATQHIGKLWKIGDDVLKFYSSSDGAETAHDRDLTEYTFEELIRKYLLVMKAEHGTQKKAADAAGISEDKFRRHIKPT